MRFAGTLTVETPSDEEIVMTRRFDAPRHLVFAALTEPHLLRRWLGADGWNLDVCEVDLREGGAWRFVSRGPGGETMGNGGVYREVTPPSRLVYTERFDGQEHAGESLVTAVLTEVGRTTKLTTTVRFPSRAIRDNALRSQMRRGLTHSYDRLAEVLAGSASDEPRANEPQRTEESDS